MDMSMGHMCRVSRFPRLHQDTRVAQATEVGSLTVVATSNLLGNLGEVQDFLRKELGDGKDLSIRSVYLLKGFIFKPLKEFLANRRLHAPPIELNPAPGTNLSVSGVLGSRMG